MRLAVTALSLLLFLVGAFLGYVVWRNQPLPSNADYAHRLMDFNNDEAVGFREVHRVLALAVQALKHSGGSSGAEPPHR